MSAVKRSKLAEAYERCNAVRHELCRLCRSMECTEDKAGIVWERFCTNAGVSLILFATPHWFDVYAPLEPSPEIAKLIEAIKAKAAELPHPQV